ncbi:hypothetical protein FQZ97_1113450 [compost metagenome]
MKALFFGQRLHQGRLHREIHHRRDVGFVTVRVVFSLLPVGNGIGFGGPFFAYHVQVRVLCQDIFHPLRQERFSRVRPGIYA